ncbi:MAG: hypothetical protein EON55_07810 [Alphaproteobacteria bacterium]|nr:MAG: hypothetical protein EON55_07810 [Alphaproteobacteria bacterium]
MTGLLPHGAAHAALLENYEFQGQSGSQTLVGPNFVAADVIGINFGELNLMPTAGANQLALTSRSSATGPRSLSVQALVNGGSYLTVASIMHTGTAFNDEMLSITSLTGITSGVMFRLMAANQVAAGGGTIGSGGTFRIGDYTLAGTPTAFSINGTIAALMATSVPEPASLFMLTTGIAGLLGVAAA